MNVRLRLSLAAIGGVAIILGLLAIIRGGTGQRETAAPAPAFVEDLPLIVLAAPDADSWVRLERASGAAVRLGTLDELLSRPAGIVTGGVTLSSSDHQRIHRWVEQGGRLVTPHADVLAGLGFVRTKQVNITGLPIPGWAERASLYEPLSVSGLARGTVLSSFDAVISEQGAVLVGEASLGRGSVLALAVDPVVDGRAGFELFPSIGRDIVAWTRAPAGPERQAAEIYLDPGSLPAELKRDPEAIGRLLTGVRAVHVAGWNFGFRDPANDYDYASLISSLHARAILAFAWLEPPFVNLLMWEDHPECREKTSTGRDAMVGWRALMALEDPACFELAWQQWSGMLARFDWDGVNVAELYFEPPTRPEDFTPFHPSALRVFGGDPAADPERFLDFRVSLVGDLSAKILARLRSLPRGNELDLELTAIDDHLDPAHARAVGSDLGRLSDVAGRYGASLQVEDPFTTWTRGPLRYDAIAGDVEKLAGPGKALIDINVVKREGARPTETMTGAEFDLAAMSGARVNGRLAVFSVATIGARDLAHLAAAMAGTVQTTDTGVIASASVTVFAPRGMSQGRLAVDGQAWPASAGRAIIPVGEHQLDWSEGLPVGPALLRFTGEPGGAAVTPGSLTLTYYAGVRALAVVDRQPLRLELDGLATVLPVVTNPDGGCTVTVPGGTHTVRIVVAEE